VPSVLLEVGTEELPARFVEPARQQLEAVLRAELEREQLAARLVRTWATPRRLAALALDVPERQPDAEREVRGPAVHAAYDPDGRPTAAAIRFARSQQVPVECLQRRNTPAGEYVFARRVVPGRPTAEVLRELLARVVTSLSFPKTMRWGEHELRFGRPIRWIVALLDGQVIPFQLAGVRSGRCTYGHRQLNPGPQEVPHAEAYEEIARRAYVLADRRRRREEVIRQVQACAREAGGEAELVDQLVDEVTDLVEWPTAFLGRFDPGFLELPEPVLVTVMRHHQRYFPVRDRRGHLLNAFVGVRNGDAEGLQVVREGNEWVLRARLVDARFFYREDRKRPLAEWAKHLGSVTFHEKLGSLQEKVARLERLCGWLAGHVPDAEMLVRAAQLCKADLATHLVGEFPELQGVVGAIYARLDGEPEEVCRAIEEHYRPRTSGDRMPETDLGALLSVVDRADTLAGFVGLGILPTGSADPYGLRRAASALLDVLYDRRKRVSVHLPSLLRAAVEGYLPRLDFSQAVHHLGEFFTDRVRAWLVERGFPHDVVEAVLGVYAGVPDFLDGVDRAEALSEFRARPEFAAAYEAFDRAYRIWDKRTRTALSPLQHPAEVALEAERGEVEAQVWEHVGRRRYLDALLALARLRPSVARLFDEVLVNDPDPEVRARRHALLGRVVDLFWRVARVEHLVVGGES